jgi:hypothetical protein
MTEWGTCIFPYEPEEAGAMRLAEGDTFRILAKYHESWFICFGGCTACVPVSFLEARPAKGAELAEDLLDAIAMYSFTAESKNEISIKRAEKLQIPASYVGQTWALVFNTAGASGLVPSSYVKVKDIQAAIVSDGVPLKAYRLWSTPKGTIRKPGTLYTKKRVQQTELCTDIDPPENWWFDLYGDMFPNGVPTRGKEEKEGAALRARETEEEEEDPTNSKRELSPSASPIVTPASSPGPSPSLSNSASPTLSHGSSTTSTTASIEEFESFRKPPARLSNVRAQTKTGFLTKRGGAFPHSWKQRWFDLSMGVMEYSAGPGATKGLGKVLLLNTIAKPTTEKKFGIVIQGPNGTGVAITDDSESVNRIHNKFLLAAKDAVDQQDWIDAINGNTLVEDEVANTPKVGTNQTFRMSLHA